uniref:Uncharacterized protein MANES_04G141800 n=2 Tax=Rhizophora mucronata TaxID=61149 RepID=A0A2P2MHW7_RHIMU
MGYASHLINHSKRLRNVPRLLRHEHASLVQWISNDTRLNFSKTDDVSKVYHNSHIPTGRKRSLSTITNSNLSPLDTFKRNASRTIMKMGNPTSGKLSSNSFSCSQTHIRRGFASDSGLPPHQELGMPSLSPTMTEGNIGKWLKKEGDKISPGEVLCEVETDKATVEMECMEEGYLAKIIKGDGSTGINVGEIIAITVEDEEDIVKFKDYSPSKSKTSEPSHKDPSPSPPATPPKEEKIEEPVSSKELKISKPSAVSSEDRIFASPLARKLAEDHNVSDLICFANFSVNAAVICLLPNLTYITCILLFSLS